MSSPSNSTAMMMASMLANQGPQGPIPLEGLVNPVSMMSMAISFVVLGTLLTVVRFITRRMQRNDVGWDDWLIIPALVLMLAMCINMITAVALQRFGYILPIRKDPNGKPDLLFGYAPEIAQTNLFDFVQQSIAPIQLMFTKMSVVFFYRRVLVPQKSGGFHWITLILLCIITVWGVALSFAFIFSCGTRWNLYWNGPLAIGQQVCISSQIEGVFVLSDALIDLIILVLPIPKIFKLKLSLRKKLLVTGAFLMGALTVVTACVRLVMVAAEVMQYETHLSSSDEGTEISVMDYWGMLESGLSVIVACLPALQYLVTRSGPAQLIRTFTESIRSVSQLSFRRSSRDLEKGGSSSNASGGFSSNNSNAGSSAYSESSVTSSGLRTPKTPHGPFTPLTPRTPVTPGSFVARAEDFDFDVVSDYGARETRQAELF